MVNGKPIFFRKCVCDCRLHHCACTFITYVGPLLPVEHRPSANFIYQTQLQAVFFCLSPAVSLPLKLFDVFHLHLFLGCPLFHLSWGFHVEAWPVLDGINHVSVLFSLCDDCNYYFTDVYTQGDHNVHAGNACLCLLHHQVPWENVSR